MYESDRQTIGVVLTMDGAQDTSVAAHHAGSESAVVGIRIGRALIYVHDREAAATLARVWGQHTRDAAKLPRQPTPRLTSEVRGVLDAAVVIDTHGMPPVSGRLVRPPGRPTHLRIQLARVVFDIRDIAAFASTQTAFRDASALAASVLAAPAAALSRREQAFGHAVAALRPTGRRRSATLRPAVRTSPPSPTHQRASSLGQERGG